MSASNETYYPGIRANEKASYLPLYVRIFRCRWALAQPDRRPLAWKTISKGNITSLYGVDSDGRLADPAAPSRIFKWLLQQSHDDKGNVVIYGAASVTLNKDVNLAKLCVGSSALFVAGAPFTLSTADPGDLKELTMLLHYSVSS